MKPVAISLLMLLITSHYVQADEEVAERPRSRSEFRVRNGVNVNEIAKYPFLVLLRSSGNNVCSGSLIRANLVLTAAHCLCFPGNLRVYINTLNIRQADGNNIYQVAQTTVHPDYTDMCAKMREGTAAGSVNGNDIGVAELASDVEIGTLAKLSIQDPPSSLNIVGYGYNEQRVIGVLREGVVNVLSECPSFLKARQTAICAVHNVETNRQGIESGDSGGPILDGDSNVYGVASGILSYSNGRRLSVHAGLKGNVEFLSRWMTELAPQQQPR